MTDEKKESYTQTAFYNFQCQTFFILTDHLFIFCLLSYGLKLKGVQALCKCLLHFGEL